MLANEANGIGGGAMDAWLPRFLYKHNQPNPKDVDSEIY